MVTMKVATVATKTIKVDQEIFSMSEEDIKKHISTVQHGPSKAQIEVKPVFDVADNIFKGATLIADSIATGTPAHMDHLENNIPQAGFIVPTSILENINREIGRKALHGESAHQVTLSLLNMLSSYSWDAKAVMTLAAFAVEYGEFWFLTQHISDQLAKPLGILKKVPVILNPSVSLKLGLFSINNLVKAVVEVASFILQIQEISTQHTVNDLPALGTAMASVPVYVYWTIMTVVYCACQIYNLTTMGDGYMQAPELFSFSHILTNVNANLQQQLEEIKQNIAQKGVKKVFGVKN